MTAQSTAKPRLFWSVVLVVIALDIVTKMIAVSALLPRQMPHQVIGEVLQFTLVYNPGAAFGLNLGPLSRIVFLTLTVIALYVLARLYRATRADDLVRTLAIALVCGGAMGNLIDRVRSAQGVVDFIDVGVHTWRWPTFNVADMAVSTGAFLLALVLWNEDRHRATPAAMKPTAPVAET